MPQRELDPNKGVFDPATSFLFFPDKKVKFQPDLKLLFLEKLKELGDVEEACKFVGINRRILKPHMRADKVFAKRYKAALRFYKNKPANEAQARSAAAVDDLWNQLS